MVASPTRALVRAMRARKRRREGSKGRRAGEQRDRQTSRHTQRVFCHCRMVLLCGSCDVLRPQRTALCMAALAAFFGRHFFYSSTYGPLSSHLFPLCTRSVCSSMPVPHRRGLHVEGTSGSPLEMKFGSAATVRTFVEHGTLRRLRRVWIIIVEQGKLYPL